jgi:flagellar motor switch protein FliM
MNSGEPFVPRRETSSRIETEALLGEADEQAAGAGSRKPEEERKAPARDPIQPHDFRHPAFLSPGELRKLRGHHEEFIRSLASRLSVYLRLEFGLEMSKLQSSSYQKFREALANPAHIVLFKIEPLRGICVLEMSPRLALTMVDRLMGGPGHSASLGRELTEIDVALVDQVVDIVLQEWCGHWTSLPELRPTILGHETNGQFLNTSHADTVMLSLCLEARMGDCLEQIQIGFPGPALEPIIAKFGGQLDSAAPSAPSAPAAAPRWKPEFDNVLVPLTAEWLQLQITAGDLARLKIGDVLQWDAETAGRVLLHLASLPKLEGRLGTRGKKWAVEVTRILKP